MSILRLLSGNISVVSFQYVSCLMSLFQLSSVNSSDVSCTYFWSLVCPLKSLSFFLLLSQTIQHLSMHHCYCCVGLWSFPLSFIALCELVGYDNSIGWCRLLVVFWRGLLINVSDIDHPLLRLQLLIFNVQIATDMCITLPSFQCTMSARFIVWQTGSHCWC